MVVQQKIWNPITFNKKWLSAKTDRLDNILPSWTRKREDFKKNPKEYEKFLNELKRKQAIETGVIEKTYNLKEGITETFIKEGFVESYLQHGDTDIDPSQLMDYLHDNFEAVNFVFDFVKNNRVLSTSFIKELHALITAHQDYTSARTPNGNIIQVRMLKGEYKTMPNNPKRDDTEILYMYCPPEQVASEMDNLVEINNTFFNGTANPVIQAAFLHHGFTQIHPFQDGNGRIARLLASLVFIKAGLFPLAIDRKDKSVYINALESADAGEYQSLVDFFVANQVKSIERALNWRTIEPTSNYQSMVSIFANKVAQFKSDEIAARNRRILNNMEAIFNEANTIADLFVNDIQSKLGESVTAYINSCSPTSENTFYYTKQIVDYANKHDYYFNSSLERCWIQIHINISDSKKYRLIFSIHHYGYDNSTFAIGSFISNRSSDISIDIPLEIPPLTISAEANISALIPEIESYMKDIFVVSLAFISNEI